MDAIIRTQMGDITQLSVDAIVNAANISLLGGGGVDGAIHRADGPELVNFCRTLGGCPTGEARISPGFRLAAKWIIHTVGPIWRGGNSNEDNLLASCYRNSLALADTKSIYTIAFPAISTGVFRFPLVRATSIAIATVQQYLTEYPHGNLCEVIFVCFSPDAYEVYNKALKM
jgi:O-acetyl-ADP-ribose deacetylase (regulator of RNase III)